MQTAGLGSDGDVMPGIESRKSVRITEKNIGRGKPRNEPPKRGKQGYGKIFEFVCKWGHFIMRIVRKTLASVPVVLSLSAISSCRSHGGHFGNGIDKAGMNTLPQNPYVPDVRRYILSAPKGRSDLQKRFQPSPTAWHTQAIQRKLQGSKLSLLGVKNG